WVRLNSVIITFSGFKSGTCQRYSGRVKLIKKADYSAYLVSGRRNREKLREFVSAYKTADNK
ncbi:hypothetical protein, partial [Salmonella enterica]